MLWFNLSWQEDLLVVPQVIATIRNTLKVASIKASPSPVPGSSGRNRSDCNYTPIFEVRHFSKGLTAEFATCLFSDGWAATSWEDGPHNAAIRGVVQAKKDGSGELWAHLYIPSFPSIFVSSQENPVAGWLPSSRHSWWLESWVDVSWLWPARWPLKGIIFSTLHSFYLDFYAKFSKKKRENFFLNP